MKYGESSFDIFYLLTAIIVGCLILKKARNRTEKQMGLAVLILGCGDAFHLVPRVLNYFVDADFTAALGIGKLVTSITMTVFYVLLYHIGCAVYGGSEGRGAYGSSKAYGKKSGEVSGKTEDRTAQAAVYGLAAVRIILCLFPQNGWLANVSGMLWESSGTCLSRRWAFW